MLKKNKNEKEEGGGGELVHSMETTLGSVYKEMVHIRDS